MYQEKDVWEEVLVRLDMTPEETAEKERKLRSFIRQARQEILDYCNIPAEEEVPPGLFYVWISLAQAFFDQDSLSGSLLSGNIIREAGGVKSITEGDTTITYGGASEVSTLVSSGAAQMSERVMARYQDQLNHYRRLSR